MEQWEYRTIKYKTGGFLGGKVDAEELEDELNQYGSEGWELVSCFDTSMSQGASRDIVIVFKRIRKNITDYAEIK
ncbi:DUF4177 domain-containing protein [Cohnella suwonensis]|uniref:DUF4177 domain-containing protein n=1 Tax=Cohnella suwonensis TaxID=696072 RepID=A0ABW0M3Y2_9BACL